MDQENNWKKDAACKGKPLSWFFEDYEDNNEIQLIVDKLCAGCVVKRECDEYAIVTQTEGGVFARKYREFRRVKLTKKEDQNV